MYGIGSVDAFVASPIRSGGRRLISKGPFITATPPLRGGG
jgi:hypothetical protein